MKAAIGLGANLGDRLGSLKRAVHSMAALGGIQRASCIYETLAVGGPPQGDFLNAAVLLETALPPLELLDSLQGIERALGRVREVRWGPRTIDLDILYGDFTWKDERLVVPHPRLLERPFATVPLAEVWPEIFEKSPDADGLRLVAAARTLWPGDVRG